MKDLCEFFVSLSLRGLIFLPLSHYDTKEHEENMKELCETLCLGAFVAGFFYKEYHRFC